MNSIKYYTVLFCLFFLSFALQAQTRLTGTILDAATHEAAPFATVALYATADSTILGGSNADLEGNFTIEKVKPGQYYLQVSLLSYATKQVPVEVSAGQTSVSIGTINLASDAQQLEEVVVSGERDLVEFNLDKKVVNLDKNLVSLGGSVVDALQNVPSIQVDENGELSLRGSGNVTIFINGRQSALTRGEGALQQIPASAIERVEIITNPSARYDASGTAGIINIVLKKQTRTGLNGNVQVNVGTNDKYNAGVNLNYGFKRLKVFTGYDFRRESRWGTRDSDRWRYASVDTLLSQHTDDNRLRQGHTFRLGGEYQLTPKQTIGLSGLWRIRNGNSSEITNYLEQAADGPLLRRFRRDGSELEDETNADVSLNYQLEFERPGQMLTASATHTVGDEVERESFYQRDLNPEGAAIEETAYQQRSHTNEDERRTIVQADYVHPFDEKTRLEAGMKSIVEHTDNAYVFENYDPASDEWTNAPQVSNQFVFDQQIHGAYVSYSHERERFSYQLGLRAEQTYMASHERTTDAKFSRNYFNLFPSVYLTRNLSDAQKIQLSYSLRIDRPNMRQLNPFIDLSDPQNTRQGNPQLNPELIHSFELGYLQQWDKFTLNPTVFVRYITDPVQYIRSLQPDGTTNLTFLNIGQSTSVGSELIFTASLFRWWRADGSLTAFHSQLSGDLPEGSVSTSNFGLNGKLNTTFTLSKKTSIQFSGNYQAPAVRAQGRRKGFAFADIAARRDVLAGKGTVTLRVSDIFNTMKFGFEANGAGFRSDNVFKRESRIAYLGFSYRFGSNQMKNNDRQQRRDDNGAEHGGDDFGG
ncbi:Outer membrane receptor proteins, mostly Fe transport [Catalinimonas alkaloidigena]|uniref:Outer membrane receptor proteins, mostly Fe transport n=1 Tax=Catalinimonas alkaloidigena TaxID=1075417 RepID=A0A1G8ZYZ3_9BACT|nr:outer membrane beta-barrel family protein [Catalinimonas alkaloidigena]SDK19834.1 Outer membrane receptor proteins, mostly Fe transport [Catalinimonas alkaloidigena]